MNGASFGLLPGFVPNGSVVYIRCYGDWMLPLQMYVTVERRVGENGYFQKS